MKSPLLAVFIMPIRFSAIVTVVFMLHCLVGPAYATEFTFTAGSGNWEQNGNWNSAGYPSTTADSATINTDGDNVYFSTGSVDLSSLKPAGTAGRTVTLHQSGGNLTVANSLVDTRGTFNMNLSGGNFSF
jgi:hypothetical protein